MNNDELKTMMITILRNQVLIYSKLVEMEMKQKGDTSSDHFIRQSAKELKKLRDKYASSPTMSFDNDLV